MVARRDFLKQSAAFGLAASALSWTDVITAQAEELRSRGVEPWFVVDEGGAIAAEAFPGVAAPIGVIGLTDLSDVRFIDTVHMWDPGNPPKVRL